jgi:hypothetical protein
VLFQQLLALDDEAADRPPNSSANDLAHLDLPAHARRVAVVARAVAAAPLASRFRRESHLLI